MYKASRRDQRAGEGKMRQNTVGSYNF